MPNGRQLAALIPRDDIMRCLKSIDGDPVVGSVRGTDVVLSEVKRLMESDAEESLFVEGQWEGPGVMEHFIVIHFDQRTWLWVSQASPAWESLFKVWMEAPRPEEKRAMGCFSVLAVLSLLIFSIAASLLVILVF